MARNESVDIEINLMASFGILEMHDPYRYVLGKAGTKKDRIDG